MKENEIPFGAFDSELQGFEYTIPDGYTAEIRDGKIIVKKEESEDDRIRKEIIQFLQLPHPQFVCKRNHEEWISWLEKQGEPIKLSEEERNRFAKGVLSECAMSFINYLDSNKRKGKMCVSNGECEDVGNAFHNCMWDRLHRYYCKYIDKSEHKPTWSEDDERIFDKLIKYFDVGSHYSFEREDYDEIHDWLKSLKNRITITNKNDNDLKKL